ncbi:hypothetical protein L1267_22295 [Pseudoalteromonas sp. OFAV1]|uniref:hypothetical protein n=1 Tax=Pseudoalteromonas sp. OFAV1 TaxID=2908892 RepID=UPI001F1781BB|nr:hypothetical protein [Pseudoalteromonas sp. OFAV1]MCF2903102.1 hypothetical protein [Pseudoalteromonas sp. OFAV1]
MVLDKEKKKRLYKTARQITQCSQNDWGRLFNLEPHNGQKGQPNVALKESGTKGVNKAECLASELLVFLYEQGFDIKNTEFDKQGTITHIPSRK